MSATHTPGKWTFKRCTLGHPDNARNPMVTAPGVNVARLFSSESPMRGMNSLGPSLEEAEANARRICACVNALDGIPTDFLELLASGALADAMEGMIAAKGGAS